MKVRNAMVEHTMRKTFLKNFKNFTYIYIYICIYVGSWRKSYKKNSSTLVPNIYIYIYIYIYQSIKEKNPKVHIKEVKKSPMGSKRYLINKKNQNVHQGCTKKQEEHIARNH
jgi:hypothetical protein